MRDSIRRTPKLTQRRGRRSNPVANDYETARKDELAVYPGSRAPAMDVRVSDPQRRSEYRQGEKRDAITTL
jgi:hypothetical protein